MTDSKGFFDEEIKSDMESLQDMSAFADILKYIEQIQQHVTQFDQIIYVQNQRIEQLHHLVSLIVSKDPELSKIIEELGKKQGIISDED